MNEKYAAGKKSRSVEDLRHLRLMALVRDLIRDEGRMEAAEVLGVNYKTLANTVKTGDLSRRMGHALERLLLYGGGSAMARQQERIQGMEERVAELTSEIGNARAGDEDGMQALREESSQALRQLERRVAKVEASQDAHGTGAESGGDRQPPVGGSRWRQYPELVTVEPAADDEAVFGAAWAVIGEWRKLRGSHPSRGKSLSWLVERERILELEVGMMEEHGLTLPPDTLPLTGLWRRDQLVRRKMALDDTQRARAKRELLRWVRRVLTLWLWRK